MNKFTILTVTSALLFIPAASVFAETASSTGSHPVVSASCVQTAVDTREAAIDDAFATFSTSETAALVARKSALHDAWGMASASARRSARTKAWTDYRTANKAAYTALRTARKAAWATFATASGACHVPVVESVGAEGTGSLGL